MEAPRERARRLYRELTGRWPNQIRQLPNLENLIASMTRVAGGTISDDALMPVIRRSAEAEGDYSLNDIRDVYQFMTGRTDLNGRDDLLRGIANYADNQNMSRSALAAYLETYVVPEGAPGTGTVAAPPAKSPAERVDELYRYLSNGDTPESGQRDELIKYVTDNNPTQAQLVAEITKAMESAGDYHPQEVGRIYAYITQGRTLPEDEIARVVQSADNGGWNRSSLVTELTSVALRRQDIPPQTIAGYSSYTDDQLRTEIENIYRFITDGRNPSRDVVDTMFSAARSGTNNSGLVQMAADFADADGDHSVKTITEIYSSLYGGAQLTPDSIRTIADLADTQNLNRAELTNHLRSTTYSTTGVVNEDQNLENRLIAAYKAVAGEDREPTSSQLSEMVNRAVDLGTTDALLHEIARSSAQSAGHYSIEELQRMYGGLTDNVARNDDVNAAIDRLRSRAGSDDLDRDTVLRELRSIAEQNNQLSDNPSAVGYTSAGVLARYRWIIGSEISANAVIDVPEAAFDAYAMTANVHNWSNNQLNQFLRNVAANFGEYHSDDIDAIYRSLTNGAPFYDGWTDDRQAIRIWADNTDSDRSALTNRIREELASNNVALSEVPDEPRRTYTSDELAALYRNLTGRNPKDPILNGLDNATSAEANTYVRELSEGWGVYSNSTIGSLYSEITGGRSADAETIRTISGIAELRSLNTGGLRDVIVEHAISAGDLRSDGTAFPPTNPPAGGGPGEGDGPGAGGDGSPINNNTTRRLRLIRGDGGPAGPDQLRNNGNAVFLVSSSGELFHVTEQLANEMRESGDWYEPEVRPQAEVNGMAIRASLNHTAEFGILNVPPSGDYLLVRGMGPSLSNGQILGNGDAVFAIDREGNRFHVTEAVATQMNANGTWSTPALLAQDTVDSMTLDGALTNASGGTTTSLSLAIGTPVTGSASAVVAPGVTAPTGTPVPASTPAAPTAAGASTTTNPGAGVSFTLVRGRGPNLGTTQLRGNGAAVYAVFPDGTKLHVTEAMARTLVANNRWVEPTLMDQAELDRTPPVGVLANLSGGRGPLEVPFEAAGSTPTPTNPATPATPVAPAASGGTPTPTAPTPTAPATPAGPSDRSRQLVSDSFYQFIGRAPSEAEMNNYAMQVDGGKSIYALNAELTALPEAGNYRWQAVNDAFRQYVGRDATWEDQNIHGPRLARGEITLEQLQIELANAEESRQRQAATVAGISTPAVAMYSEAINNIYRELVGREASADEIRIHTASLNNGVVTLDSLRNDIYWGTEARTFRGDYIPTPAPPVTAPVAPAPVAAPTPAPAPAPAAPINPEVHPALVSDLNPTGNLQKQLELNMFFGSPNPDIHPSLVSDLNPTGSIQKQKELNAFFAAQVLGASTSAPSTTTVGSGSAMTESKPDVVGSATNSSDDNAIWVTDANGERRDISGLSWDERAEVQKHIVEGGGTFGQLDQVKDIYASGDPTAVDNWERFSQTGKYSPSTPWGATYQSVVKDGYSHELAAAWADGTHADNMQQATTPTGQGVVGTAAVTSNGPNMFGIN